MRSVLTRAAAVAAALLVAVPAAAGAAVDEYAAEASTSSVKISVFEEAVGSPLLDLVSTDALAASDPMASATVGAIEVLGTQAIPVADANSEGEPDRDPAEGDGCVVPADAPGLTLDAVCAVAFADAGASDEAAATATTDLLQVGVNGSLLAGLLTQPLTEFVATLTGGAETEAIRQFTAACDELLGSANEEIPEEVPATVGEILEMSPVDVGPIGDALTEALGPNPCTALINLTLRDVVPPTIPIDVIADALDGVNLVDLSVDGARSDIAGADAALTSTGKQAFVNLTGPGLDELDLPGIISALLSALEDDLEQAIFDITGVELPEGLDISALVQQIVDALPEFGAEPLIEATVSGGRATATLDNGDGATASGGEAPYVEITFAPGILALLGQDPEQGTRRFEAGQSQTIAEGTELESTISVGTLSTEDGVTFEDTDLTGSTATASVTSVSLLNVPEAGSIGIDLAESDAGVYGALTTAGSPPPKDLPNTGGGAALAAALAIGGAFVLRRRRD